MKKIGVIDSGIGGFSLVQEIVKNQYAAEIYYICDRKNVPYGGKKESFMLDQTKKMVEKLLAKEVKGILLACNTLTVETINTLRSLYDIPFVGIEPYIKFPLSDKDENQKYGMILTVATSKSKRFIELKQKFDPHGRVDLFPLSHLAFLIESLFDGKNVGADILNEIKTLKDRNYTKLILGCTHYPLISNFLTRELELSCIDPHLNVINQLALKTNLLKTKAPKVSILFSSNLGVDWKELLIKDTFISI